MTALAHTTAHGWDALPGRAPGVSRPPLHLVPTGPAVRSGERVRSRERVPVRISRFGRLLLTTTALGVAVVLAVTLFGAGSASVGVDHTVTVMSGQTLSGIATTELPQLPMAEGVAQIRLANDLNTSQVHVGQELAIPRFG